MRSGSPEHPNDKLYNSTFEVRFQSNAEPGDHQLPSSYNKTSDGYYIIDRFSNTLGTVSGTIDAEQYGPLKSIRIRIESAFETWIIITDIFFATSMINPPKLQNPFIFKDRENLLFPARKARGLSVVDLT